MATDDARNKQQPAADNKPPGGPLASAGNTPDSAGKPAGTGTGRADRRDSAGTGPGERTTDGGAAQAQGSTKEPTAAQRQAPTVAVETPAKRRVRRTKAQIAADRAKAAQVPEPEPEPEPVKRQSKAELNRETVHGLLDAFDVFAGVVIGTPLSRDERALIEPSLERITGRMSSKAAKRLQGTVDPLCVLAGFGLFAMRAAAQKAAVKSPVRAPGVEPEKTGSTPATKGQSDRPMTAYAPPAALADLLSGEG